jgi:uncharacterized protein YqgV (UPF0045/DUF77 family)
MEERTMIQATVAIYPLQQTDYEAVHRAIAALHGAAVTVDVQTMHTEIRGSEARNDDDLRL